jgi:hypothetical protein
MGQAHGPARYPRAYGDDGRRPGSAGVTRALAAALALAAGCPSQSLETERTADCCAPEDGGDGCRWMLVQYDVNRFTAPLASDEDACRSVGLELDVRARKHR